MKNGAWYDYKVEVNGRLYEVTLTKRGTPLSVEHHEYRPKGKPRRLAYWHHNTETDPAGENAEAIIQAHELHAAELGVEVDRLDRFRVRRVIAVVRTLQKTEAGS